jgi:hypothetical protein
LLARLAPRPLLSSNISPAALFRIVEKYCPTLLVDEADSFLRDKEELRGILNSGHTRDAAYVVRTVGDDNEPCRPFPRFPAAAGARCWLPATRRAPRHEGPAGAPLPLQRGLRRRTSQVPLTQQP